ncbi:growth/differentiation factor 10b isoform 2-T2 [Menidia menidia]
MDLARLSPLFLFSLCIKGLLANVAAPANVSLQCYNFNNTLTWGYDDIRPGLRFRVDIRSDIGLKGCNDTIWVDQPSLEADISFLSDPGTTYSLKVTAVIGLNESEASPPKGLIFSYFHKSPLGQKCYLDLPPVSLSSESQDKVLFSFEHPWLVYQRRPSQCRKAHTKSRWRKQPKETLRAFQYKFFTLGKEEKQHSLLCEERLCNGSLPVDPEQDEHCLKFSGELEKMLISPKHSYCTKPPKPADHTHVYVSVGLLAVVAVAAAVLLMVFCKVTRPSTPLPKFMSGAPAQRGPMPSHQNSFSSVTVDRPLLSTPESDSGPESPPLPPNGSAENEHRMPLQVPPQNLEQPRPSGQNPPYMPGSNLEEEEEEEPACPEACSSGYESRAVLDVLEPEERHEGSRG